MPSWYWRAVRRSPVARVIAKLCVAISIACGSARRQKKLEEDLGGAGATAGPERVVGNLTRGLAPLASIETLGIAARGIEHQQTLPEAQCQPFGRLEQRRSDAVTPRTPMHQHLGNVAAMRLVLRLIEQQLYGADDRAVGRFGQQQTQLTALETCAGALPEGRRLGARHRQHEADRGAAFDAVDQHIAQALDLARAKSSRLSNAESVQHAVSASSWARARR